MSVSKLSEELIKAGVGVDVFTTTANGLAELPVAIGEPVNVDGVSVIYFPRITKDHSHFSPKLLSHLWKHVQEYDAVHIHAWWNLVSMPSAFIAQIRNVPVLISPRGTLSSYSFNISKSPLKKIFHALAGKSILKRAGIHATSVAEKYDLKKLIDPTGLFEIPNFVKFAEIKSSTQTIGNGKFRLLFLSRIDEKKGLEHLLNALPLLTIPYQLTIAGNGEGDYMNGLKTMILNNNTHEHIDWIGFQGENKFDVLNNHDLMILPSYNENFGNVVIESLSVGTAVLISDGVGLADYVTQNNLGWLCETNAKSIADRLNNIYKNKKDELLRIKAAAPGKIAADFDEAILVHQYINMYNQITQQTIE